MSVIWILGEFGSKIEAAPYLLEDIVNDAFDVEEELSLSQKKEFSSEFRLNVRTNIMVSNFKLVVDSRD